MENLHIVLQCAIILIWVVTAIRVVLNRKVLTLDLLGLSLVSSVLMLYIVTTNLTLRDYGDRIVWNRPEWYFFDVITALIINKVVNVAKKINKTLNCFANKNMKND